MKLHHILSNRVIVMGSVALVSATSMAYGYYSELPTVQQEGNISYVTGGVGDEERTALESTESDYNLHVMNSRPDGAFTDDAHLTISDRRGNALVSSDAGPIFYAHLPAGKYTITAEYDGTQQEKKVKIPGKGENIHFVWK